ncbi:MAG: V-type ATPase 116kDa subunit family protein [Victivallales bacterium]
MIVKMKKVSLICLSSGKVNALEELRNLGAMHVELGEKTSSPDYAVSEQELLKTKKAINFLIGKKGKADPALASLTGTELVKKANTCIENEIAMEKKLDSLLKDREKIQNWGEFSADLIAELRENNIFVYLCAGNKNTLHLLPSDVSYKIVHQEKGKIYFAVISGHELDTSSIPVTNVPMERSLRETENQIDEAGTALQYTRDTLKSLTCEMEKFNRHLLSVQETIEFITNHDGMVSTGEISYLTGYVPVDHVENLRTAAKKHGWGLLLSDPTVDDKTPTLLKVPKIFQMSKPIFDFIGISPSYHEIDISICFLIFFSLFFGILVGDAGYAMLMIIATLIAKFMLKGEKAKQTTNLFLFLGSSCLIWGMLIGSFFGIESHSLPRFLRGFEWFKNQENVRYVCFFIAAIHLSIAHLWIACIKRKKITTVLGQSGWVSFIWANFFLASSLVAGREFPSFAIYLYVAGFVLILIGMHWHDIGEVCEFPFALVGSFTDLLSYIRLFAVGLAGLYVGENFNKIAHDGLLGVPSVDIVLGVFIIFIGHGINILLGALAVLVHGIRLNTLEFSGHIGLRWSGFLYKPFKKTNIGEIVNDRTNDD